MVLLYLIVLFGFLSILMGFIALLAQKIYMKNNNEVSEIEIPLIGKMKFNYPALIFVFIGVVLIFYSTQVLFPKYFTKAKRKKR